MLGCVQMFSKSGACSRRARCLVTAQVRLGRAQIPMNASGLSVVHVRHRLLSAAETCMDRGVGSAACVGGLEGSTWGFHGDLQARLGTVLCIKANETFHRLCCAWSAAFKCVA